VDWRMQKMSYSGYERRKKSRDGNGNEYFKGMTEAQIKTLFDNQHKTDESIKSMSIEFGTRFDCLEKKVDSLRLWRATVIGASAVISFAGGFLSKFIWKD